MLAKPQSTPPIDLTIYRGRQGSAVSLYDLHSVYVITCGRETPCKVGVARDPNNRLASLQTGQPGKLAVRFLLWSPAATVANKIERAVHKALKKNGAHVNGEWFKVKPSKAAESIRAVAAELYPSIEFCDHEQMVALMKSPGFGSRLFTSYSHQERNFLARAFNEDPKSSVLPKLGVHEWAEVLKPMSQVRIMRPYMPASEGGLAFGVNV